VSNVRETERALRAEARRARGMLFEPIRSLDEDVPLYDDATPEARLVAMARLCRAAWLASGRPWPSTPRAELPGEVFRIEHRLDQPRP
jgi:hypothetical protein